GAAVVAGAEAEGDAFAAERLEGAGDVDALAAGLDRRAGGAVELVGHERMLDAQGTVHGGIERDGNNHEGFLLRAQSYSFIIPNARGNVNKILPRPEGAGGSRPAPGGAAQSSSSRISCRIFLSCLSCGCQA